MPMMSIAMLDHSANDRTSNALLTQLPSEQNVLFPAPKRNQKQQFLLTGRERAGPTGSMLLKVLSASVDEANL